MYVCFRFQIFNTAREGRANYSTENVTQQPTKFVFYDIESAILSHSQLIVHKLPCSRSNVVWFERVCFTESWRLRSSFSHSGKPNEFSWYVRVLLPGAHSVLVLTVKYIMLGTCTCTCISHVPAWLGESCTESFSH